MREKGWKRKSEGERRKEKRTGHQRGTAARRHPDDSWSNYVRVHAAGEGNVATSESDISERRPRDYAGRGFV